MNKESKCCKSSCVNSMEYSLVIVTRFWDRVSGFLVARPSNCVLLISPCKSIHTFGVKEKLDVAFVDSKGVVIRSVRGVPPGRIMFCRKAHSVLERRSLELKNWYCVGERVRVNV